MPKFTFICEDEPMPFSEGVVTKRTVQFDAVYINDIVEEFELFLRGAGFNPSGTLEFVEEQDYSDHGGGSTLADYPELNPLSGKSSYYFDVERNKPLDAEQRKANWLAEYDKMGNSSK